MMYNYRLSSAANNVNTYRILDFNYFQTIFPDGDLYDPCEISNLLRGLNPDGEGSNSGRTVPASLPGPRPWTGLESPMPQERTLAGLCQGGNLDP